MFKLILKYIVNRNISRDKRQPSKLYGGSIERIAVVSNYSFEGFGVVGQYVRELRERGVKQVDFIVEFDNLKNKQEKASNLQGTAFCPKEIGFFGTIKSAEVQQCLDRQYQVVLDLTDGKHVYSDLVLSKMDAMWRVGMKRPGREKFLDLIIDGDSKQLKNAIEHLNSYLFNLNNLNAA